MTPLFTPITAGFLIIVIYVYVKISTEGVNRFEACRKTILVGGAFIYAGSFFEWMIYFLYPFQYVFALYIRLIISFILGSIFIATMCIDLAIQWVLLKKEPQSLP